MSKLFDVIKKQREEAGWCWADVIAMLEQSRVHRKSGKAWTLNYVRKLYQREVDRRIGRGSWRAIKKGREAGDGAGGLNGAWGGSPGGTGGVGGTGADAGRAAEGGGAAVAASPGGTGLGAGRDGGELAGGEVARAERAPAGMRGEIGGGGDRGVALRPVEERMSLRPRPRTQRGVNEREAALGNGGQEASPLPEPKRSEKPRREWTVMDDFEFWGASPSGGVLRGPPPDWDGESVWDPDTKAWKPPDGIVLLN
ncbi:hypothetical protein [Azospirillum canadense]|uniref:hypothetical protein n=1 Tax=Azospirillum canadense TaxID=403962 RepID=UPI0022271AD6|nr:hypothetical protein [Azospirillum canadense]MCW2240752.1 hypothetical protein [Azospirillum canadense]